MFNFLPTFIISGFVFFTLKTNKNPYFCSLFFFFRQNDGFKHIEAWQNTMTA